MAIDKRNKRLFFCLAFLHNQNDRSGRSRTKAGPIPESIKNIIAKPEGGPVPFALLIAIDSGVSTSETVTNKISRI